MTTPASVTTDSIKFLRERVDIYAFTTEQRNVYYGLLDLGERLATRLDAALGEIEKLREEFSKSITLCPPPPATEFAVVRRDAPDECTLLVLGVEVDHGNVNLHAVKDRLNAAWLASRPTPRPVVAVPEGLIAAVASVGGHLRNSGNHVWAEICEQAHDFLRSLASGGEGKVEPKCSCDPLDAFGHSACPVHATAKTTPAAPDEAEDGTIAYIAEVAVEEAIRAALLARPSPDLAALTDFVESVRNIRNMYTLGRVNNLLGVALDKLDSAAKQGGG